MNGLDAELEWQRKRLFGPQAKRFWGLLGIGLLGILPIGSLVFCAACVLAS